MSSPISSTQFKGAAEVQSPLSLSSSTTGSLAQQTAWRSPSGAPLSARNRGTTLSWGDEKSSNPIPKSDKGTGRNEEEA
jgi:hypothetical protein